MIDATKKKEIEAVVFESIGEGSMSWKPRPTGVFDSTEAGGVADRLVKKIIEIVEEK